MFRLLRSFCFLPLVLGACSAPPTSTVVPPATPAEALVRLRTQAAQLRPLRATATPGLPLTEFEALPPATLTSAARLAEAKKRLVDSPNILNQTAEALMPGADLPAPARRDLMRQLRQTLRQTPQLDLGWAWLASLQAADRQLAPDSAMQSLNMALYYNQQLSLYFAMRARLQFVQKHYVEAAHDYQAAITRHPAPRPLYKELAAVYAAQQSDQLVTQTWEWVLRDIRRQLPGVQQRGARDSVRLLEQEMGYGYLARSRYFIETRQQPALGCPDLARALAAGVAEAAALHRQHCR